MLSIRSTTSTRGPWGMIDLLKIVDAVPDLELRKPGVWFATRQAAISYPEHGNALCLQIEDGSFWFRHRSRCIEAVVRRLPPNGPLLDIGGGNGYVSRGLEQAGIHCVVLEPGVEGALAAHSRGLDTVVCGRLEDVRFPAGSFCAAGMFDVLEHFADDADILAVTARLLRPGGRLYLTVPAYQSLFSSDDVVAGHFRRYTMSRLARTLDRVGYRLEYGTYMFWPLVPAIFLMRVVPSWFGLHKGADPDRAMGEHRGGGRLASVVNRALEVEARMIEQGRSIAFGGSCLVCARRR
jgi:SAM-dependent methyltransferase